MRRGAARLVLLAAIAGAAGAAVSVHAAAAPDPKLRDELKAGIDLGVNWLRWQIDADGRWNADETTTADVIRVFAESHRKYVEEDGPFMRRPVALLRATLQRGLPPITTASIVLALTPLKNPADAELLKAQGPRLTRWIAESAAAVRPVDLERLALVVSAARAAGVAPGGELLDKVRALVRIGTAPAAPAGFADALRAQSLLYAGAPPNDASVQAHVQAVHESFGWWNEPSRASGDEHAEIPLGYWLALARALDAHGATTVTGGAGRAHDWKGEIAREVLKMQQFDGNWLQRERIRDTVAAVGALELIYRQ